MGIVKASTKGRCSHNVWLVQGVEPYSKQLFFLFSCAYIGGILGATKELSKCGSLFLCPDI